MKDIVGGTDAYENVLKTLVTKSSAICPSYSLSECELQAMRKFSGGEQSMCSG
jgi:trans-2-enoyl-CoA reductase